MSCVETKATSAFFPSCVCTKYFSVLSIPPTEDAAIKPVRIVASCKLFPHASFAATIPSNEVREIVFVLRFNFLINSSLDNFISPEFDATFFQNYCEMLLSKNSNACLCGYVNALENSMEAFLFFVEKTDSTPLNLPLTSKILTNLYKE